MKFFCDELAQIKSNGGLLLHESMDTSIVVPIEVRCFITDTPARAFLVSTRYPTHHNGCHRCEQRKVKGNFSAVPGELRTDDLFNARAHPTHHSAVHESQKSVLEQHNFKMISQFPIDVMHLIDLGACKLIITSLLDKKIKGLSQDKLAIEAMSNKYAEYSNYTPSEFSRLPPSLDNVHFFKATEFRQFLL